MNGTITSSGEADFPSVRGAHYLLFTLTGACLLSFVDRFTLNVLLGSIKGSMHLSDAQIGLLVGFAFSAFYSVLAMPLGWIVDRGHRRDLLPIRLVLWSTDTDASGPSPNLPQWIHPPK